MGPSPRTAGLFYCLPAAGAGFALLTKYLQVVGKIAGVATGVDEVLERCASDLD